MNNSFSDAVKQALAKKQETAKPKTKTKQSKSKTKNNYGVPMITGTPVRKASGRGG